MTWRRRLSRLLALVQAGRLDRELDDEIAAHLEMAERDAVAAGASPAEARRQARRQFGHIDAMREVHRDDRSARWIEIGIRLALGARSADVLSHVLQHAVRLVAIGLALGLAGAWAVTRVMENLLFQVSPLDPVAIAAAAVSMLAIGPLAGLIPASRAAALSPVDVLRDEG